MIEILIEGFVGGVIASFLGSKLRRPKVAKPPEQNLPVQLCPWAPRCQEALPETPLVSEPETSDSYAIYESESCPGCQGLVIWSEFEGKYMRYSPKKE